MKTRWWSNSGPVPGCSADLIVSGLPWVAFPVQVQEALPDSIGTVLAPVGVFTTFGYAWVRGSSPARRFRRLLGRRFEEVVAGRTVIANVPPAFVYHARRPRHESALREGDSVDRQGVAAPGVYP
jgi:phospholipid N-methyltransferase